MLEHILQSGYHNLTLPKAAFSQVLQRERIKRGTDSKCFSLVYIFLPIEICNIVASFCPKDTEVVDICALYW